MTTLVHPFVATPLRHVCAREETVTKYNRRTDPLPRVFRSFGPSQGLASIMRSSRARAAHFSRKVLIGTHACTHGKSTTLRLHASPYRFSLVRGIFLEGPSLVTGYPRTSRQANFWQSSTAPPCAAETRASFGGHRTKQPLKISIHLIYII